MNKPSIDIIIPTFNRGLLLKRTLDSILNQKQYPNNIFVIDDGSTDNTKELVEEYNKYFNQRNISINYIYQDKEGVSVARNRGIILSTSKFIVFLDSDDLLTNNYIETFSNILDKNLPDTICYSSYDIIDIDDKIVKNHHTLGKLKYKQGNIFADLQNSNLFIRNLGQAVFPRKIFETGLKFDKSLTIGEDWDLLMQIAKNYSFKFIDEHLIQIREHSQNTISNKAKLLSGTIDLYIKWIDIGVQKKIKKKWGEDILFRTILSFPNLNLYNILKIKLNNKKYRLAFFPKFSGNIQINLIYVLIKEIIKSFFNGSIIKNIKIFLKKRKNYQPKDV